MKEKVAFLDEAVSLAFENIEQNGRPFGAIVVKDGEVIARAVNRMEADSDPTAHAELLALREAGRVLGSPRLEGCEVYASGQPCAMCTAAMRLAGIREFYYAYSNEQALAYGLSTPASVSDVSKLLDGETEFSICHLPPGEGSPHLFEAWQSRRKG
jgi:guanine deaminase